MSLNEIDSIKRYSTNITQIIRGDTFIINIYCEGIDKYDNIWSAGRMTMDNVPQMNSKKLRMMDFMKLHIFTITI